MDRQGLIDPAIRSSLKKKLSPFDVTQHRGFDAVDKFHGPSAQKGNFNTNTGRQTKPNRVTVTEAPGEVMAANRVMDKTTPELTTSGGKVKLYQAGADDIQVARLSVARMEEMAPNLLPSLKEIHFARSTGSEISQYSRNGQFGLQTSQVGGTTLGYMNQGINEGGIIVRKGSQWQSQASFRADQARNEFNNAFLLAESNGIPLSPEVIELLKEAARKNAKNAPMPDRLQPTNRRTSTTIHEAAHHFDKANGTDGVWFSETPGSGFGEGSYSLTGETDFVCNYASTKAREDFAETAAFIANFHFIEDKLPLPTLSTALVDKIRKTGELIGTPKEQVEAIIRLYNG